MEATFDGRGDQHAMVKKVMPEVLLVTTDGGNGILLVPFVIDELGLFYTRVVQRQTVTRTNAILADEGQCTTTPPVEGILPVVDAVEWPLP